MSGYQKYKHVFPSWEVYPRVHYFQKRFNDLLVRFNRVTGALPESFREKRVETVLEQVRSDFERGLQVTVIGKEDIDEKNLVITTAVETKQQTYDSPELQKHDGAKLNVVVCHIDLESLGEQAIKDTTVVFELAQNVSHSIILKCDSKCMYQEADVLEFKTAIMESRQYCLQQEDILFGSVAGDLQKRISDKLEDIITDGFSKIGTSLQRFESNDDIRNEITGEIIESDEVANAIKDFLLNLQTLKDLKDLTNRTEDVSGTFGYRVLHHLCHVIKCAAVPLLARKYSQQLWVCNKLLQEIEFEEALVHSVTKNTSYHLSKIEKALKTPPSKPNKDRRFLFLLYPLRIEMKSTFEDTEKKFSGMQRLSLVTRKLLFETNGYIKQTNLGLSGVDGKKAVPAKISDDLREDLLSVKGVYGLGTIYGKLEVHLDPSLIADIEEKNDMKTDKVATSDQIEMDMQDSTSNSESTKLSAYDYDLGTIYGKLEDHRDQRLIPVEAEKNSTQSDEDNYSKQTETNMQDFSSNSERTKTSGYDYDLGTTYRKMEGQLDQILIADEAEKKSMQSDNDDNSKQTETDMQRPNGKDNKTSGYDYDVNRSNIDAENERQTQQAIKADIAEQLKKHHFNHPYTVKYVEKKAEVMNGSFDPGEKLLSPTDEKGQYTFGTIGGYAVSTERKLYGLTCLHVIGIDGKVYTDNGEKLFGTYRKGMENTTYPFIDIAAVEVISTLQDEYKNYLERAMTRVTKVKLSFENTNELIGRYVYKFGAATGVTKGTIMSVDYSLFNSKAHSYLIVIDPLAADTKLDDVLEIFSPLRGASQSTANNTVVQSSNLASQSVEQHKCQTDSQPNYENKVVTHSLRTSDQAFAQSPIIASQDFAQLHKSARPALPSNSAIQSDERSTNKQNETAPKVSNCANQSVVRSSDTQYQSLVRPSDTERQSVARSPDTERQFVARSSDTARQFDEGSSDTESQSVVRDSDTERHSVARSSDTKYHSVARSSDTELQSVARSLDAERQFVARSSDAKRQSDERSSDTESQSVVLASDTERHSVVRSSDTEHHSVPQPVRKSPSIGTHTIWPRYKGASQTITQTSTSLNVINPIQIKSKVVSQSQNNEGQMFTEQADSISQRVAQSFNDANQRGKRSLNSSGQRVTDLLYSTSACSGHEMIAEQVFQYENVKDSNDMTEPKACPNKGQNEIQLESKLENRKLNGCASANVDEAKQTKNVDSSVTNYEMQENDAVGKVNSTQTYGKKQRSRSPVQKLILTSSIEDSSEQAHTDVDSTTLLYVRDTKGATKNVDSSVSNYKLQENDAVGKFNATQTYGKKQRSRSPVQKLVLTSSIEDSSAQAHTDDSSTTLLYVRDINGVTESDESRSRALKGAFSLNGDSGAIICTPDPSSNGLTCLALSMLTGGSLEISGRPGLKSLSFTLREGLDKICKHCDLKFL